MAKRHCLEIIIPMAINKVSLNDVICVVTERINEKIEGLMNSLIASLCDDV